MKIIFVGISCLFILGLVPPENKREQFIRLHYNSVSSKPYPMIIFYLSAFKNSVDDDVFTKKYLISTEEYNQIKDITEEYFFLRNDTTLKNSFQFTFYSEGDTTVYQTTSLGRLRNCFASVRTLFHQDSTRQRMLQINFNKIFRRLKWDEQLVLP